MTFYKINLGSSGLFTLLRLSMYIAPVKIELCLRHTCTCIFYKNSRIRGESVTKTCKVKVKTSQLFSVRTESLNQTLQMAEETAD